MDVGAGHARRGEAHAEREYHRQMNLLLSRLDEQQRRWYLAVESERIGLRRRPAAVRDHGRGRKDHSPGPRGVGGVAGGPTRSIGCASLGWRPTATEKKT